jgi:hypothetical protein
LNQEDKNHLNRTITRNEIENGKMRHVETIPGLEGEGIKENYGGYEFNHDIW